MSLHTLSDFESLLSLNKRDKRVWKSELVWPLRVLTSTLDPVYWVRALKIINSHIKLQVILSFLHQSSSACNLELIFPSYWCVVVSVSSSYRVCSLSSFLRESSRPLALLHWNLALVACPATTRGSRDTSWGRHSFLVGGRFWVFFLWEWRVVSPRWGWATSVAL